MIIFSEWSTQGKSAETHPTTPPTTQLNQFKSFAKCLKSADSTAQVLPIRSDINIHPISTTDQLNSLEAVGIMSYFKPYKWTQKHISVDFHIAQDCPLRNWRSTPPSRHGCFRMAIIQWEATARQPIWSALASFQWLEASPIVMTYKTI
jgi:hypothetical protein